MADYSIKAELEANASKYKQAIQSAKRVTEKFKRTSESVEDTELNADTSPLRRNLKKARAMMSAFAQKKTKAEIDVEADTSEATRKMGLLQAVKTALSRRVVIPIEARISKFQSTMNRIANTIQSFNTIAGNTFKGIGIMVSSSLVPIIASLVPVIMAVGNALGVVGSGAVALGAAFGIAGGAAVAFGAAAAPTIKSIIDGTAEATKENIKAAEQLKSLKSAWQGVQDAIAPQVATAFGNAMEGLQKIVQGLNPMFTSMADTVVKLSERFNKFFESSTAKAFFDYLNKSAAPIFEKLVDGIAGFIKGLMNLTVAFAPLTDFMAQGFADMGNSFAKFTEKVAGSQELQSFISYVKQNLPVIKQIFGDAFRGIINLFVAFSENSSLIFDALAGMMSKFREWSAAISESDGFQQFIQYVQTNGPKVVSLIGNIITFIVNLGIALAPLGSAMLDIINKFINFTNKLMESNPIIGKIIALVTVLAGGFIALIPNIVAIASLFSGLGGKIVSLVGKFLKFTPIITGLKAVFVALTGPIGIAIAILVAIGAAVVIAYKKFETFREIVNKVWEAIKSAFQTAKTAIIEGVRTMVDRVMELWQQFKPKLQAVWDAVLAKVKEVWATISDFLKQKITEIKEFFNSEGEGIKQAFTNIWNFIKTSAQTAWAAIQGIIKGAMAVIKAVISNPAVIAVAKAIWATLKSTITMAWNGIKNVISGAIDVIKGIIQVFVGIFTGDFAKMWEGIKNIVSGAVQTIWGLIQLWFVGKILGVLKSAFGLIKGLFKSGWKTVTNIVRGVFNRMKDLIQGAFQAIKNRVSSSVSAVKNFITTGFNAARNIVSNVMSAIRSKISSIWSAIQSKISSVMSAIRSKISSIWSAISSKISSVMSSIRSKVSSVWSSIKSKISSVMSSIKSKISSIWSAIKSKISSVMSAIRDKISSIWQSIKSKVSSVIESIKSTVSSKFQAIKNAVSQKMQAVKDKITEIWNSVMDFLRGIDLTQMGKDIIQGLINGVGSMAGALVKKAKGVVDGAINGAKKLLGINSPSRVFREIGVNTGEGMAIGLSKMNKEVAKKGSEMAAAAVPNKKDLDVSPQLNASSAHIRSSLNRLKRNSTAQVESALHADVQFNERRPANINLRLGDRSYKGFVGDISDEQRREAELEEEFS